MPDLPIWPSRNRSRTRPFPISDLVGRWAVFGLRHLCDPGASPRSPPPRSTSSLNPLRMLTFRSPSFAIIGSPLVLSLPPGTACSHPRVPRCRMLLYGHESSGRERISRHFCRMTDKLSNVVCVPSEAFDPGSSRTSNHWAHKSKSGAHPKVLLRPPSDDGDTGSGLEILWGWLDI
jgi:hypothetical protein